MNTLSSKLQKAEFEARIFVSFAIVIGVLVLSYGVVPQASAIIVLLGNVVGISEHASLTLGFSVIAVVMALVSLLRMWGGSVLSSQRVMSFRVRTESLEIKGPYRFTRNPIYLADFVAMTAFSLCLPLPGLLLPVLFLVHYHRLIGYEELSLAGRFPASFSRYRSNVPRLFPDRRSFGNVRGALREFVVNRDGVRHNALYVLFVPGFVVAAVTSNFIHAVLIGIPAVIDWAIIHTKIGIRRDHRPRTDRSPGGQPTPRSPKKVFERVLYAQCWEDPSLDRRAFQITPEDVVFSITSGGCNVLTFLLDDPQKVIALDINPHQNYLLDLKIGAFRALTYEELLEFVGAAESDRRWELYERVRPSLGAASRSYWDGQRQAILEGVIHSGSYERYMHLLRKWICRMIGAKVIRQFFDVTDAEARRKLFEKHWNNIWWWIFTRVFLSRTTMSLLFDKAFFAQLDARFSFGKHFAEKARHALTKLPTRENYFLAYVLLGRFYSSEFLPVYLRREHFSTIRERVDRIMMVNCSCEAFFHALPDDSISKFNFTNIFEWMPAESYEQLLHETIRVAQDGAVLTYRNLLVKRERPDSFRMSIVSLRDRARQLHEQDLSFIYDNYVVEKIRKEPSHAVCRP